MGVPDCRHRPSRLQRPRDRRHRDASLTTTARADRPPGSRWQGGHRNPVDLQDYRVEPPTGPLRNGRAPTRHHRQALHHANALHLEGCGGTARHCRAPHLPAPRLREPDLPPLLARAPRPPLGARASRGRRGLALGTVERVRGGGEDGGRAAVDLALVRAVLCARHGVHRCRPAGRVWVPLRPRA